MINANDPTFTAVILAADRGPEDPVATAAGVPCKSLAPIGGSPMVFRVLDALAEANEVGPRILCGPPQEIIDQHEALRTRISSGQISWVPNQATPSTSAYHVLQAQPDDAAVLVTTADHALLRSEIVDYFCSNARNQDLDIAVGLAQHSLVMEAYPGTKRTATKLRDGAYCSCNLFAFLTPRARKVADFWRQVESQRKNPLRVMSSFGWITVLRFLLGRLSLTDARKRISHRLGINAGAVILPFPEAAVDVDTVSHWRYVQSVVADE